jgi:hypothetical protein
MKNLKRNLNAEKIKFLSKWKKFKGWEKTCRETKNNFFATLLSRHVFRHMFFCRFSTFRKVISMEHPKYFFLLRKFILTSSLSTVCFNFSKSSFLSCSSARIFFNWTASCCDWLKSLLLFPTPPLPLPVLCLHFKKSLK